MNKPPTPPPPSFPALVQQFFTEYLVAQRAVSPRTVACYRDAITLFLAHLCHFPAIFRPTHPGNPHGYWNVPKRRFVMP